MKQLTPLIKPIPRSHYIYLAALAVVGFAVVIALTYMEMNSEEFTWPVVTRADNLRRVARWSANRAARQQETISIPAQYFACHPR